MSEPGEAIRMEIKGLMLDPSSNMPIVVLRDEDSKVFLPIWIGVFEANAIALRIEGIDPPRPMTHDLLHSSLVELGASVQKVTICELKENTFYALISLQLGNGNGEIAIDSRPSDAIALALRAEAPIFVLDSVLQRAKAIDLATDEADEERLKKWLEEVRPEDLGKYTM